MFATKLRFPYRAPKECKRWVAFETLVNSSKISNAKASRTLACDPRLFERHIDTLQLPSAAHEDEAGSAPAFAALSTPAEAVQPLGAPSASVGDSFAPRQRATALYIAFENETPTSIAKRTGTALADILALNRGRFPVALFAKSRFKHGTRVLVPAWPLDDTNSGRGSSAPPSQHGMTLMGLSEDTLVAIMCRLECHLSVSRLA